MDGFGGLGDLFNGLTGNNNKNDKNKPQ